MQYFNKILRGNPENSCLQTQIQTYIYSDRHTDINKPKTIRASDLKTKQNR